jgi:hypothetical protein
MAKIEYHKTSSGLFGVKIGLADCGQIVAMEDGFYVYFPPERSGYFPSWVLFDIAKKLDELNAPLKQELQKYFEGQP